MKCCFHPGYQVVLPDGHPFPITKYSLLKEQLLAEGILAPEDLLLPEPIDLASLERVHSHEYLHKLQTVGLSRAEERLLGMPFSPALWQRSRLSTGGTVLAARTALRDGLAGNLAGGTHHAFVDHGEGFCVLNDVAVALTTLLSEGAIRRAAIVDLDVHQGNGSAAIFAEVAEVFTFSMHGERNYPSIKMQSSLDVGLPNGSDDTAYLEVLERHLPSVLETAAPDIVFYLAGVDVAAGDRYGKLALTEAGIRARERRVIDTVCGRGIPLVILLAGGYAATRARTAELHAHVFREAVAYERRERPSPSRWPLA